MRSSSATSKDLLECNRAAKRSLCGECPLDFSKLRANVRRLAFPQRGQALASCLSQSPRRPHDGGPTPGPSCDLEAVLSPGELRNSAMVPNHVQRGGRDPPRLSGV